MTFPLNATVIPADNSRTLVTIATYNEIENLPRLVEAIWEVAPQADILVIDDNRAIHEDFRKILGLQSAGRDTLEAREAALFGEAPPVSKPSV